MTVSPTCPSVLNPLDILLIAFGTKLVFQNYMIPEIVSCDNSKAMTIDRVMHYTIGISIGRLATLPI